MKLAIIISQLESFQKQLAGTLQRAEAAKFETIEFIQDGLDYGHDEKVVYNPYRRSGFDILTKIINLSGELAGLLQQNRDEASTLSNLANWLTRFETELKRIQSEEVRLPRWRDEWGSNCSIMGFSSAINHYKLQQAFAAIQAAAAELAARPGPEERVKQLEAEIEKLRAENAALKAQNSSLQDQVQRSRSVAALITRNARSSGRAEAATSGPQELNPAQHAPLSHSI